MEDKYLEKWLFELKNCYSDSDRENIIDKIYEEGFED